MGLFNRKKSDLKKTWAEAYAPKLNMFKKEDTGHVMGSVSFVDGIPQILPDPNLLAKLASGDTPLTDVRMTIKVLPAEGQEMVFAELVYSKAVEAMAPYILARENSRILVRPLTPDEIRGVIQAARA